MGISERNVRVDNECVSEWVSEWASERAHVWESDACMGESVRTSKLSRDCLRACVRACVCE